MVLTGLIGVLGALNVTAPDPQAIRAELERELEALELIASQDPCRGDLRAEELLRVELYRTEARALYLKLERRHASLHSIAQLERAAQKEVPPYLARCRDLSPRSHPELERLADEGRSLLGNYGATRFAASLKESLSVLEDRLATQKTLVSDEFLKLSAATRKASEGGAFSTALRQIEAFQSNSRITPSSSRSSWSSGPACFEKRRPKAPG